MAPIIKEIFKIDFRKEDTFNEKVSYNMRDLIFIQINRDHASDELSDSLFTYDKDHRVGVQCLQ